MIRLSDGNCDIEGTSNLPLDDTVDIEDLSMC